MVKEFFSLQKSHFTSRIPSAKHVYNWFHNSNYCKGGLNGFVHETDQKFNTLSVHSSRFTINIHSFSHGPWEMKK